jgi:hypothetical protein
VQIQYFYLFTEAESGNISKIDFIYLYAPHKPPFTPFYSIEGNGWNAVTYLHKIVLSMPDNSLFMFGDVRVSNNQSIARDLNVPCVPCEGST